MKSVSVVLCALLVSLLFASCGSTHKKLDLPRDQVAQVRGLTSGFKLLGMSKSIVFTSIDGAKTKSGAFASAPDVIDVMPGKHVLGVYYNVDFDGQPGPDGDATVELDAHAGKTYQLDLVLEQGGTRITVSEASADPR